MTRNPFVSLVLVSVLVLPGSAAVARGVDGPRPDFDSIDADGNGEISREELTALRKARFDRADANGDGQVSVEELQAVASERAARRAARMIDRMDQNGDGALSVEEMADPSRAGRMFSRMDRDGSGTISKAEFEELRAKRAKRSGHAPGAAD